MANFIPRETIAEVQKLTDIVEVIGRYVSLKRTGKNYVGLCPFHAEKTPSFTVSPDKQLYKCFGCGEGGTVFSFLMKKEGLNFPEVIRTLARKANIVVAQGTTEESGTRERIRLYELNKLAAEFFHRTLLGREGEESRDYLNTRQIKEGSIVRFKLGYAPKGWDSLVDFARGQGVSLSELERAGLVVGREEGQGFYDRFRHRLMFPIFDALGRGVGFGGRTLDGSEPKYLNSPETAVFSKGKCLYGLEAARSAVLKDRKVLVMEGYTDVIMAHQNDIAWAVGVLGTALTREHIRLLRQWAEEVILVLDSDTAGQRSSDRNLDVLIEEDIEAKVVQLPEGYDPCDFILEKGRASFLQLVEGALDFFSFKVKMAGLKRNLSSTSGKVGAIKELLFTVSKVSDELRRELIIRRLSEEMSVEEGVLRRHLSRLKGSGAGGPSSPYVDKGLGGNYRVERELLGLLISHNELIEEFVREVGLKGFQDQALRKVAEEVFKIHREKGAVKETDLIPFFSQGEEARGLADITLEAKGSDFLQHFHDCLSFIKRREIRREIGYTKERAKKSGSNQEEEDRLVREFHERNRTAHLRKRVQ